MRQASHGGQEASRHSREERAPTPSARKGSSMNALLSHHRGVSAPLALLSLVALLFASCDRKAQSAVDRPPAPVSVATAIARDAAIYLDEVDKCVAPEVVSVQPQVSGRIMKIP